jgi:hypothetical protein
MLHLIGGIEKKMLDHVPVSGPIPLINDRFLHLFVHIADAHVALGWHRTIIAGEM